MRGLQLRFFSDLPTEQCASQNVTSFRSFGASEALRDHYRRADVFVFPSFFEGLALVLLEAMACGLPAIASAATGGADVLTEASGRLLPVGDLEECTWDRYRRAVTEATSAFA